MEHFLSCLILYFTFDICNAAINSLQNTIQLGHGRYYYGDGSLNRLDSSAFVLK